MPAQGIALGNVRITTSSPKRGGPNQRLGTTRWALKVSQAVGLGSHRIAPLELNAKYSNVSGIELTLSAYINTRQNPKIGAVELVIAKKLFRLFECQQLHCASSSTSIFSCFLPRMMVNVTFLPTSCCSNAVSKSLAELIFSPSTAVIISPR